MPSTRREVWLRIRRAISERGFARSLAGWALRPGAYIKAFSRIRELAAPVRVQQDEFDRRFGLDTVTPVHRTDLGIESGNLRYAVSYGTIPPEDFYAAMASVTVDLTRFAFIDFGSGKGRIALLASDYPFDEIIGLEISPRLHEIALKNLEAYRNPLQRCSRIHLLHADFAAYFPPAKPLFCFLYNPCEEPLMNEVIENVRRSLVESPSPSYVMYFNPRFAQLWENAGFEKIAEGGESGGINHYLVYSWTTQSAGLTRAAAAGRGS